MNTKFKTTDVLLLDKTVTLQCSADADPVARFSFAGAVKPVSDSTTGKIRVKLVTNLIGRTVSCTPSNRLGVGPTVDFLLDVKGKKKCTLTWHFTMCELSIMLCTIYSNELRIYFV